ncbi:MAG: hypothetical protein IKJ25_06385 [Clostridia bacterium]|nr:hypothetical protein [Clostridia bacterium]
MNKTKRIFAVTAMLIVLIACAMLAGCSPDSGDTGFSHVHTLTRVAPKAATCLEDGNREYYICSGCNKTFGDAEGNAPITSEKYVIPAKEHNVAMHSEKKATCFSNGIKAYYECRNCGTLFRDADGMFEISAPASIPATSHSLTKVEGKAAVGFTSGWQEHYACDNCDKLYKDALGTIETTFDEIKIVPVLTDFEYKIAFTPAANIDSGSNYISASYVEVNGLPATEFTLKAGTPADTEAYAWIHQTVSQTMPQGINLRIPTFSGKEKKLSLTVTNSGSEDISFRFYAENYGDKGGVNVTVGAGETKTVEFTINPGSSTGCNLPIKILSSVNQETKLTMQGFFYCEGEVDGISLYKDAEKKTFKVGDKFSTDGLVVKAKGSSYDEVVIANYMTDIEEGYVFTAEDVGTKTVTVAYGEYTTTYEITIES